MITPLKDVELYLQAFDKWLSEKPSATVMLNKLVTHDVSVQKQNSLFQELDKKIIEILKLTQDSLRYRRVFIVGDNHLLSKAHNWYVPQNLTKEMCDLLENTDQPFGYVIRDTKFLRKNIGKAFFPENLKKNEVILRHQAILYSNEKAPLAFVEEAYYPQSLKFFIAKYKNKISNTILT